MTKIDIFGNLDENRDISNEMEVFLKLWPNLKFSRIVTNIGIFFSKFFSKIDISDNFDQNRGISKIFPKIEIFEDFDQNRYFPKILT